MKIYVKISCHESRMDIGLQRCFFGAFLEEFLENSY
jgi:hypothetical protein